jgi:hypothetical protein
MWEILSQINPQMHRLIRTWKLGSSSQQALMTLLAVTMRKLIPATMITPPGASCRNTRVAEDFRRRCC